MTQKQLKLLFLLLAALGVGAFALASKQAECEAGLPQCESNVVADFIRIYRAPMIPPEAVAASLASAISAVEEAAELIDRVNRAREAR